MENEVKLGDDTIPIKLPSSYAVRADLGEAISDARSGARVFAGALGLCWNQRPAIPVLYRACNFNVLEYGGKVFDHLREKGYTTAQIQMAGIGCARFLSGLSVEPTEAEEAESEDSETFTEELDGLVDFTPALGEPSI